jgi:hypothetical protein
MVENSGVGKTNNASEATGGHNTRTYLEGGHISNNTQPYLAVIQQHQAALPEVPAAGGEGGAGQSVRTAHALGPIGLGVATSEGKGGGMDLVEERGVKSVVEDRAVEVKRGNHSLHSSSLLDRESDPSLGSGLHKFASTHKLLPAPWFVNETHDWALEGDAARIHTLLYPRRPTHTHTHTQPPKGGCEFTARTRTRDWLWGLYDGLLMV